MSKSNFNQHHPYVAKLRKWRSPIFNFGLACSLGLVTLAFNWTSYNHSANTIEHEEIFAEPEMEMIRTNQKVKKTPPPVIKASSEIIPEEIEFNPEPEPIPEKIIEAPVLKERAPTVFTIPEPPAAAPIAKAAEVIDMPFVIVEEMPRFNGCEDLEGTKAERKTCADGKLLQYIYKQISYPNIARENHIEGTVVIQFVIEKDGSITDIKIAKEIGGGCGVEAARVVKSMPNWIPGKQRGKEVQVRYNLPVRYKLQ